MKKSFDKNKSKGMPCLVFHFGQERLFLSDDAVEEIFVPTGRIMTPHLIACRTRRSSILKILKVVFFTGCDYLFLPGVNLQPNVISDKGVRKLARDCIYKLHKAKLYRYVANILVRLVFRPAKIVVLDKNDYLKKGGYNGLGIEGGDVTIFSFNVPKAELGRERLQYFISVDHLDAYFTSIQQDRRYAVSFVGSTPEHNPRRHEIIELKDRVESAGIPSFFCLSDYEAPLSWSEYLDVCKDSKLCVSPAGEGWHCFRHYETMLCGAVPLINIPEAPLKSDLVDGVNCILYHDKEDLFNKICAYERGELKVSMSEEDRISFARQHGHDDAGRYILKKLNDTREEEV
jgi:hypothetical protein